jgi:hypothetical protein
MNITPTYVTFEQAKLINYPFLTDTGYSFDGNILIRKGFIATNGWINRPEQWQVVEWLRVNHGIWVYVDTHEFGKWCFNYKKIEPTEEYPNINVNGAFSVEDFNSPQEALSAAFDYVLNKLI